MAKPLKNIKPFESVVKFNENKAKRISKRGLVYEDMYVGPDGELEQSKNHGDDFKGASIAGSIGEINVTPNKAEDFGEDELQASATVTLTIGDSFRTGLITDQNNKLIPDLESKLKAFLDKVEAEFDDLMTDYI